MSSLEDFAGRPVRTPIEQIRGGFAVGIPSLGVVPLEFAFSLSNSTYPINFGPIFLTQNGWVWDWDKNVAVPVGGDTRLPVADARNVITWLALQNKAKWLLFRDDDTIAPPETPNRLYVLARDCMDRGIPISCVGGNYMSKQFPPHSLILLDGHPGGYENWRFGDLVEVANEKRGGAIGMGITLISCEVLEKMEPPWFKTVHSSDPKSAHFDHMAGRVIHDGNDIWDQAPYGSRMTEDVYFCKKARRYGFTHVYSDTAIQGQHINISDGARYYFHAGLNRGVCQKGSVVQWLTRPGDPMPLLGHPHPMVDPAGAAAAAAAFKRPDVVRFDLGQPGKKEGWITVDLFEPSADEQLDIHNLTHLVEKYGLADEIRCSHILEHFPFGEVPGLLVEWTKALKPGGTIFVEVPDAEWGCENLLRHKDLPADQYPNQLYKLIGLQTNPGDFHKCLFTKTFLASVLGSVQELEGLEVEFHEYPDVNVQRAIRARARRRADAVSIPNRSESEIARARVEVPRVGEQIPAIEAPARASEEKQLVAIG